ncbi:hypothetical protein I4U23_011632 [Adineta vaga]|nr:hypothetical protein I4U23_011632 [Adineta vaga]
MSNEIEDHRLLINDEEPKQCRICLDTDNSTDLISPCLCSGGSAFIHRQCLDRWRSENIRGIGFKSCDICHFEYVIESVNNDEIAERTRRLKYYLYVTRDTTVLFLLVQLVIVGVAFIIKLIDKNSEHIKDNFPQWMNVFVIYYLSAVIVLLALIGFITLIIAQCSSNSRGGCNLNGGSGCGIVLLIFFVLIGLVVGIVLSAKILQEIVERHTNKLWLRQEAKKYIVKDFQRHRDELEKYNLTLAALAI